MEAVVVVVVAAAARGGADAVCFCCKLMLPLATCSRGIAAGGTVV